MPETEFGKSALELIERLHEEGAERMFVMMRHSARYHDLDDPLNELVLTLTEEGKQYAYDFGKLLPKGYQLQPLSSASGRCIETAYLIDKGYSNQGGVTRNNKVTEPLSPIYIKNPVKLMPLYGSLRSGFIRHWFDGKISTDMIEAPKKAASHIAASLLYSLKAMPAGTLNIGVSHDWNLYLVKEFFLNLKHEEVGEVQFLEGLAVYEKGDKVFMVNHQSEPVPLSGRFSPA